MEKPDYIFETSWEVCNKVGGIHTVISSKALTLVNEWEDKVIMIGPDVWKGMGEHPEFKEDAGLYHAWKAHAEARGLKIKIGRWKITGNPVSVLVDFTTLFPQRDEIFKDLWLKCKIDSLSGGWDYIEPALFGYAAAKAIECFYHCYLTYSDKIIAHFHEWLTGFGVHYLEEHVPQIGTLFTTHATVVGRAIAGNGLPLYSKFDSYDGDHEARNFNITAKHSCEKVTAMHSDCFTTVSEVTARECRRFLQKEPDIITPNGFEDFIVPDAFFFKEKRVLARKKLFQVAQSLLGQQIPEDSLLVLKSGRYEFHNKGIDLFIDALGEINSDKDYGGKNMVAFIFIPASQTGPKKDLQDRMAQNAESQNFASLPENPHNILTHHLQGADSDPIMNRLLHHRLNNAKDKKVKVIYAPVYLDGMDGIFNLTYYDLIVGFDLGVFPSYYEPWGYTPLESIAFHIPSVTTNLAGFGLAFQPILNEKYGQNASDINNGLLVLNRNDNNDGEVSHNIAETVKGFAFKNEEEVKAAREAASRLSLSALWKNYISHYKDAYSIALTKAAGRAEQYTRSSKAETQNFTSPPPESGNLQYTEPIWHEMSVQLQLPENLQVLYKLARNLWWTWNYEAERLTETISEKLWEKYEHNPITLLETLSFAQMRRLEKNKKFIERLNAIHREFEEYKNKPALFNAQEKPSPLIAYFCMEYGLYNPLNLYSGGLGILAGDYLKQASDSGVNMVAVGLLYRNGFFRQEISAHGEQIERFDNQTFNSLPLHHLYDKDGDWFRISLAFPGRTVYAKVWLVEVGKIPLYLLDTDVPQNRPEDRNITNLLYGGDWENRLKQELLLGIGGVRVLRKLGINPDVYHYNEGHAAFASIERLIMLVQGENISFDVAAEVVKSQTLFTTHTPVPAGHDTFNEDMLRAYLAFHCNLLNISWKRLMSLGTLGDTTLPAAAENGHPIKVFVPDEKFSMSYLAAHFSEDINAVSKIHESVSRKLFNPLWKSFSPEELEIGHITNGIHIPTWVSDAHRKLYEPALQKKLTDNIADPGLWEAVKNIPDDKLWDVHLKLKSRLIDKLKTENDKNRLSGSFVPALFSNPGSVLIIGFARRFVTYKRALLPFRDLEKLYKIIMNEKRPVVFLFAGKAHPNDGPGRDIIKKIIELAKKEESKGHIFFLENYDMELAKYLTQGVDVWLNTPEPGKEASGTSGMKAALNGVLNFSVADGWWAEAWKSTGLKADKETGNGWVIPAPHNSHIGGGGETSPEIQFELDAEAFYHILENEIIPAYFNRGEQAEVSPAKWMAMVKNSISKIAPTYSTGRMLNQYMEKYYIKLQKNYNQMKSNHFEKAKKLVEWKKKVAQKWNGVNIISAELSEVLPASSASAAGRQADLADNASPNLPGQTDTKALPLGSELKPKVVVELNDLSPDDIGVEILFIEKRKGKEEFAKIINASILTPQPAAPNPKTGEKGVNNHVTFQSLVPISRSGVYEYGFRVFPKNPLLVNKLDFPIVKWA